MSKNTSDIETTYEPTAPEQAVIADYLQRRNEKVVLPNLEVDVGQDDVVKLVIDHPSQATGTLLLMDAPGIQDTSVFNGFLQQLVNAISLGRKPTAAEINFALKTVIAIGPRDAVEAMLAAQMVAVHQATMTFARRLNHVEMIMQQDSAAKAFTKLNRTYTAQMEALRRYRTGGEQKVTVEHVTVHEGGQAIVGNVSHGGGEEREGAGQPHELYRRPTLHRKVKTHRRALQGTGGDRLDGLSIPRRWRRRAMRRAQWTLSAWSVHQGGDCRAKGGCGSAEGGEEIH